MSGLYVNSNYNTLVAASNMQQTVGRINETMRQLSTGVAITPKSDPAAFIASTMMQSDIVAANQAVKNAQLDNAVLNIAESGMSQISSLLNEAKALSVAAANTGATTPEMQAAYQQQMNAILGSVDRISKTTNYMGVPLLDGSYTHKVAQLGTDVVSSQQADLSIPSMSTGALGSDQGLLYQIASGGPATLSSNPARAASIIDGAISQVATDRANVGATQKYTLDTAEKFMQDYMVQLVGANATIADTDFAIATSNLARDMVLLGSGASALSLSGRTAEYAASLLR